MFRAASLLQLAVMASAAVAQAPPQPVAVALAEDVVSVGPSLVMDGIPPLPRSLADEVSRFTELRQAFLASWHPSRREMLVVTRLGATYQAHHLAFPGGSRRQMTFFPDPVMSGVTYSPKGDAFVFLKDAGGNEAHQLYRQDLATGETALLTDGSSRNGAGIFSRSGDRIAWISTKRNGRDGDLWVMDPLAPAATSRLLCALAGGSWEPLEFSPDDTQLLLLETVSANEGALWLVDVASGAKNRVTRRGAEPVSVTAARFSGDGRGAYLLSDRDSEFLRISRVDLATGAETPVTPDLDWNVDELAVSPDGRTVAFVVNEEGLGSLRLLDVAGGKVRGVATPPGVITRIAWRPGSSELGFNLETSRHPPDVYSFDAPAGTLVRWTESETGGLPAERFALPELVHAASFDGRAISGFLYKPAARFTGKRPVIIDLHGGPEQQFRPGFLGPDNYALEALGVARLYPNVRGSSGYGKAFLKLDDQRRREDAVRDVLAFLDFVKTRADLDAGRVMVSGASYGGYLALSVAASAPERIRCALAAGAPSSLVTFLEGTSPERRELRRVEYGDERSPDLRDYLSRIAPVENAAKIARPLFLAQGKNDPRVPLSEAQRLTAAVRARGTPVWSLVATDEGHGFFKRSNYEAYLTASALFIREHLLR